MGLSDWIPGLGSSDGESAADADESVETFYLADETPWKTELRDYRLMIGPDRETDGQEWAVYRCTDDDTKVPQAAQLFVFQEGRVVSDGDSSFQLHLAQLAVNADEDNPEGYIVEFPAELTGESYSEMTVVDDDQLRQYVRSLPSDF